MSTARKIMIKEMSVSDKQKASLDTLKHLRDFCEENHIRYYLAYGTLLGTVRHKGFIPWDDDVDVWIPRPDYERFLSEYNNDMGNYKLVTCFLDKEYHLPYSKLDHGQTARLNKDGSIDKRGIGIDIFPLDGLPQDVKYASIVFEKQNNKFLKVINKLNTYAQLPTDSVINVMKFLVGRIAKTTGFVNRMTRQIAVKQYVEEYDECEMIACVTGVHSGKYIPFEKEWFNSKKLEFEGELFNCPCAYDKVLKKIYGDYMTPPPERDRQTTHTELFVWRQY